MGMKSIALAVVLLFSAARSQAQNPPAPDALETGWRVQVTGGYSNLQNQSTNNGFLTSAEVRVAKHWSGRFDYFATASPKASTLLAKAQYDFSLAHVLPASSYLDVSKLEVFVNAGAGAARGEAQSAPFKLAISAGGGLNYRVSDKMIVRPLELNYVRSAVTGTQIIGNHLQFAASFGYRF